MHIDEISYGQRKMNEEKGMENVKGNEVSQLNILLQMRDRDIKSVVTFTLRPGHNAKRAKRKRRGKEDRTFVNLFAHTHTLLSLSLFRAYPRQHCITESCFDLRAS